MLFLESTAAVLYSLLVTINSSDFNDASHFELPVDANKGLYNIQAREKRQEIDNIPRESTGSCDFGTEPNLVKCNWSSRESSILQWELGAGSMSNWLGGPDKDVSGNDENRGGYIFVETSITIPPTRSDEVGLYTNQTHAFLESPILGTTGAVGKCISFSYQIDGLSSSGLLVYLQPLGPDGRLEGSNRKLWMTRDRTNKIWLSSQILYTYNRSHQIVFEGIAKEFSDPLRRFRGYVAIDNVNFKNGLECRGHCTFEGGFCGWTNDEIDDFNWSLGHGSRNPSTGPNTDRYSFMYGGTEGGYAYVDSSYPRRPGDSAKLSSMEFEATGPDLPMCLHFWTHMFGNGIGSLTVSIRDVRESVDRDVWQLSGEAGNTWYEAEVPVSSSNPFKIVITGKVGKNNLGDIAIDDLTFVSGSCPTAPQIAGLGSGDCTFEVDECGWSNIGSRERLDDIDWERASGAALRTGIHDHTLGFEKGYFMTLSRTVLQKAGSRAWFTSRDFRISATPSQPSTGPKCISFWFIMNEPFIDSTGPSLGAMSIYTKSNERDSTGNLILKPIWRLYNHQGPDWQYAQAMIEQPSDTIIAEGIWGSSRASGFIAFDDITFFSGSCSTLPKEAKVRAGECRFERDMCDWTNITDKSMTAWRLATITRRPSNLVDKTFGSPDGYIYYDLFNQNLGTNMVKLISPLIPANPESQFCFSFWYAAFGAGDTALMQISRQENLAGDGTSEKLWSLEAKNMDTTRPTWAPAQVTVDSSKDLHIVMEGQATNGGFAVDDISFTPGSCPTRPEKAATEATSQKT